MICIVTSNSKLRDELVTLLNELSATYRVIDPSSDLVIDSVYDQTVTALIVDNVVSQIGQQPWLDLLTSLARKIPVFVLGQHTPSLKSSVSRSVELLGWIDEANANSVMAMLNASGVLSSAKKSFLPANIPVFNMQVPMHMIQGSGALSMLVINASGFRKISVEYGFEVYSKLQDCFEQVLFEMWGQAGNFRRNDIIMRRSSTSNTYYVFLEQSRVSKTVPAPGVLEKVADRITLRLQQIIWSEIFRSRDEKRLPDCIQVLPDFSLGHATAIFNPCLDTVDVVEHLIETASDVSKVQLRRVRDREREILQTIIHSRDILYPNYQAIFDLQKLSKENVDAAKTSKSITPLMDALYGFESLIRVRQESLNEKLTGDHLVHMDMKLLRPDILFAMAAHSKVALELDQLCLGLGVAGGSELPGPLMVNILPRNLLHLDRLAHLLTPRGNLVFEISESEGFSNTAQIEKVRSYVQKINCAIAADDFGKGHASIERVIKMRPALIKLDRSLVERIHLEPAKKIFVEGIIKAARSVGSLVLAEGIESWDEAKTVQSMGIDFIQGFLLHRPEPLEKILEQLKGSSDVKLESVA